MDKVLIINGHQPYPFAKGDLNRALADRMQWFFEARGAEVRVTETAEAYDVETEIANHQWADTIVMQFPVNWMGVPWSFKKYMDYVYSFGMDGRLCDGDGRTRTDPSKQYGSGGTLTGKRYMLSLTFNAPCECFNDPSQTFFEGKSPDDLFWPMHLNFRFFGMEPLPTFACYDVMKNPDIENDLVRYHEHLVSLFPSRT